MSQTAAIGNGELKALAAQRIGAEHLTGLLEWYQGCLDSDAKYVVFVVRRSYLVALIMEQISGRRMSDSADKLFVTDSAILACCRDIARYYEQKRTFPKILVCDDVLLHGRNLNRLMEGIENCIFELLPSFDRDKLRRDLVGAVHIRIYCYASNRYLLLKSSYLRKLVTINESRPFHWHQFSSQLSSLVVESGMANAAYIASEIIDDKDLEKVRRDGGYDRFYFENIEAYVKSRILYDSEGKVYAIYTLRILRGSAGRHRVIPFVFLPNLSSEKTEQLFEYIKQCGLRKGYAAEFFDQLSDLKSKVKSIEMRSFNEWITLIFSQAILREFNEKYHISLALYNQVVRGESEAQCELKKLARNYRFDESDKHIRYLNDIISQRPIFSHTRELDELLITCCRDTPITALGGRTDSAEQIQRDFEDHFYEQGYQDEVEAMLYNGSPLLQRGVTTNMVKACSQTLDKIMNALPPDTMQAGIAVFLLMMDAGVLALSSAPASDTRVSGYSQFAKAGEQSLLIKPLRYFVYVPFLTIASEWCSRSGQDLGTNLRGFMRSGFCQIDDTQMEELIAFVEAIDVIGQKVADWGGSYYEKIHYDFQTPRERMLKQYDFEVRKNQYASDYRKYIKV